MGNSSAGLRVRPPLRQATGQVNGPSAPSRVAAPDRRYVTCSNACRPTGVPPDEAVDGWRVPRIDAIGGTPWRSATPRTKWRCATACGSTTPTSSLPRSSPNWPRATASGPTCAAWSSRWPRMDGWESAGPKEWGGQGRSAIEQFIFFDESMRAGAPVPMLTINTVGPTIMNFGTEEQKQISCPGSWPATFISASATRSRARAPTWPRSRLGPSVTVTST